jgi:hypothetical protein
MTLSAKQVSDYPFVDAVNGAVLENPLSAGLIGLGLLWMFFGNTKIGSLAQVSTGALAQVNDGVRSVGEGTATAASGLAESTGDVVRQAGDAVKTTAAKASAAIRSAGSAATRGTAEFGQDVGQSLQANLTQTLDRQPLLLGLIGLGIGASIASMFSSTEVEQELVGATAAAVKNQFGEFAHQVGERAEKVLDDVKQEARDQGLTPERAAERLKEAAGKVTATAAAARDSILPR